MTARFERRNHGTGHSYRLDGEKIPGVTDVIGVLDKPGLKYWASRVCAQVVLDEWDELGKMDPSARFEHIRTAPDRVVGEKATRGKRVHAMAERVAAGEKIEIEDPEIRARVDGIAKFLDEWDLHPIVSESPVCSTLWRYAGTFDAIMVSPRLGTILIDYKNKDDGRAPYPETSLQLAAYRNADVRLIEVPQVGPRGGKLKSRWDEAPMIEVDDCYVIGVSDSTSTLWPMVADEQVFSVFQHLLEVRYEWIARNDRKDDAYAPPVGEPIFPEEFAQPALDVG